MALLYGMYLKYPKHAQFDPEMLIQLNPQMDEIEHTSHSDCDQ